jgi:hypothetical protein
MKYDAKNTVTRDGWNVGTQYPRYDADYNVLAGVTLSVFKIHGNLFQYGDANGKVFPNCDAAYAYAFEHGYLQKFVHAFCRVHRTRHTFLGKRTGFCPTRSQADVIRVASYFTESGAGV